MTKARSRRKVLKVTVPKGTKVKVTQKKTKTNPVLLQYGSKKRKVSLGIGRGETAEKWKWAQ